MSLFSRCKYCKQKIHNAEVEHYHFSSDGSSGMNLAQLCHESILNPSESVSFGYIKSISSYEFLSIMWCLIVGLSIDREWGDLARYVSKQINIEHPISHCLHNWDGLELQHREHLMDAIAWLLGDSAERMVELNEKFRRIIFPGELRYSHTEQQHAHTDVMYLPLMKHLFPEQYRSQTFSEYRRKKYSIYFSHKEINHEITQDTD